MGILKEYGTDASPEHKVKFKLNDLLVCTHAASPGYKVGRHYSVVNHKGILGVVGDDGFFDSFQMLVSTFKKVDERPQDKAVRLWNNTRKEM